MKLAYVTVTLLPRTGMNNWGAGTDPFTRVQRNSDNAQAEALMAIDIQGTVAGMSAYPAGIVGRWYTCTDTHDVYRDDGTTWRLIWPGPGTVLTNRPGDSLSSGSSRSWAAADHNHGLPGWATSVTPEDYNGGSAGVASTFPRSDHKHGLPSTLARTDIAQTFASTVSAADLQVGGQSLGRGKVGFVSSYSSITGLANGNESTMLTLQVPIVSGRRYRMTCKTAALMSDEGSGAVKYKVYINNGGPVLMQEFLLIPVPSLAGPTFFTEVLFRGASANNVAPADNDIAQVAAGNPTFFFTQSKITGSGSASPVALPCILSIDDAGPA